MGSPPPPRPPDKDPPRRRERLWVCCRTLVGNRDASHVCTEATKPCRLWGLSPADVTCGPVHSFSQSVLTWRMGTAAAPLSRALDTSPLQTGAQTGECGPAGRALTELFARALSLCLPRACFPLRPPSPRRALWGTSESQMLPSWEAPFLVSQDPAFTSPSFLLERQFRRGLLGLCCPCDDVPLTLVLFFLLV